MKLRVVIIKFQKPLTVEQENYLIGYLKSIPDGIVEALDGRLHKIRNRIQFKIIRKLRGKDTLDMAESLIELFRNRVRYQVQLQKPKEDTYEFTYPLEDMTLLKTKIAGRKFHVGKLITDDHIKSLLQKHIFPKMKVDPTTVEISYEDRED